jgi:hypothetical protein
VCAGKGTRVLANTPAGAFVDNFEGPTLSSGWSSFNDVPPLVNRFHIMQVSGGAVGTARAGRYTGTGATTVAQGGFGVGALYNVAIDTSRGTFCVDISAFDGVTFWAKLGPNAPSPSHLQLDFVVPQENPVTGGGDCVLDADGGTSCDPNAWVYMGNDPGACAGHLGESCGWTGTNEGQGYHCQAVSWGTGCEPGGATCPGGGGCFDYPSVNLPSLTASWTQITVPFAATATGGSGTALTGVIQELEWLSLDASWDFYVDEIAFYKGTPPAGPVTP